MHNGPQLLTKTFTAGHLVRALAYNLLCFGSARQWRFHDGRLNAKETRLRVVFINLNRTPIVAQSPLVVPPPCIIHENRKTVAGRFSYE